MPVNCSFFLPWNRYAIGAHSCRYLAPATRKPSGWSMPSALSPAPSRCWTTWAAIRTAWPSPTIACWTSKPVKCRFQYKDYRDDGQQKTMTLGAEEFIRRFLLHVLPDGFQRIRYYGFLGNRYRQQKLARCRATTGHGRLPPLEALPPRTTGTA